MSASWGGMGLNCGFVQVHPQIWKSLSSNCKKTSCLLRVLPSASRLFIPSGCGMPGCHGVGNPETGRDGKVRQPEPGGLAWGRWCKLALPPVPHALIREHGVSRQGRSLVCRGIWKGLTGCQRCNLGRMMCAGARGQAGSVPAWVFCCLRCP
jgi:hypothetical protein